DRGSSNHGTDRGNGPAAADTADDEGRQGRQRQDGEDGGRVGGLCATASAVSQADHPDEQVLRARRVQPLQAGRYRSNRRDPTALQAQALDCPGNRRAGGANL
ncbi:MAG: SSU ribosomal protein S17p (S11e), partial [uncultured Thermomicrobiales bacterium]